VPESLDGALEATLQDAYAEIVSAEQLADSGLDPAAVGEALTVAPLEVEAVDPPDPAAGTRQTIAFVAVILLYGQLIGYGMWVANGVVEEKSSRVVELLLAAVRPRALMAGKILGIGVLGLAQLLVIAAVGVGIGSATGVLSLGTDVLVPVAAVLAWFVLGFGFYAAFFAAAASRVSRQEELQNVITPAIMLMLVSFFTAFYAVNAEDNPVVQALSVLPPFSALVNPVRIAAGDAAWWEVGASLVLMLAAISALVLVAARLYENGVLRMGSTMSWREAWRRNG
jgi:ABC-2 type transport system permease protein